MPRNHENSPFRREAANAPEFREVLFEFSAVGNSVKVCAVDPVSLAEATILGPVGAGEHALKTAALQKLRYVVEQQRSATRPAGDRRA